MSAPMFRFAENDAASANLWRALPPVYWFAMPDAAKPAAVVFAEVPKAFALGESRPLIASHFYGAGRVFYQGFDGTWRWRQEFEDLYHGRYWIQTIRYMARSKLLGNGRFGEVTVDRRQYQRGERSRFASDCWMNRYCRRVCRSRSTLITPRLAANRWS